MCKYVNLCVCVYMYVCLRVCVSVSLSTFQQAGRGQSSVLSFHHMGPLQELTSGYQTWLQRHLAAEPFCWPEYCF